MFQNLFRNFRVFGKSPPSNMVAVVFDAKTHRYIRRTQWEERRRIEAEQLEAQQKRMASSLGEQYDTSQRMPQTAKESYDFSQ